MIGIINYGLGNLTCVANALEHLDIPHTIVETPQEIEQCTKLILPGVGAFAEGMQNLNSKDFTKAIHDAIDKGKSILGICLGMQLLFEKSYEFGETEGLGLIKGEVLPFSEKVSDLVIPHVGWNDVKPVQPSAVLGNEEDAFYFVHSFYCNATDDFEAKGKTDYGINFHSFVERGTVFGSQFHPEKSQRAGLNLLTRYWEASC